MFDSLKLTRIRRVLHICSRAYPWWGTRFSSSPCCRSGTLPNITRDKKSERIQSARTEHCRWTRTSFRLRRGSSSCTARCRLLMRTLFLCRPARGAAPEAVSRCSPARCPGCLWLLCNQSLWILPLVCEPQIPASNSLRAGPLCMAWIHHQIPLLPSSPSSEGSLQKSL